MVQKVRFLLSSCVTSGNCANSGHPQQVSGPLFIVFIEGLIIMLLMSRRQMLLRWADREFIKVEKAMAAREHRKKMSQSDAYRTKFQVLPLPRNITTPCRAQ